MKGILGKFPGGGGGGMEVTVLAPDGATVTAQRYEESKLPGGYTELEYIESNGAEYIATGFKVTPDNFAKIRFVVDCAAEHSSNWSVNGTSIPGSNDFYVGVNDAGKVTYGNGTANVVLDATVEEWTRHTFDLDVPNGKYSVSDALPETTVDFSTPTASDELFLFAYNSNAAYHHRSKIYGAKIYMDGVLHRDFVPCKRGEDVGLYEAVTQKFLKNAGTGAFVAGEEIPEIPLGKPVVGVSVDGQCVLRLPEAGQCTFTANDVSLTREYPSVIDLLAVGVPVFTYTGDYEIVNDDDTAYTEGNENWKIRFLTSGEFVISTLNGAAHGIDVFLVGGGGAGGCGYGNNTSSARRPGGGGGGGYTTTDVADVTIDTVYQIVVGAGGLVTTYSQVSGAGGTSSAFDLSAAGGGGGNGARVSDKYALGGAGGSGGGDGDYGSSPGGAGGSDGSNGFAYEGGFSSVGLGQGTSTREFRGGNTTIYAGGGGAGGGGYSSGVAGGAGGAGGGGKGGTSRGGDGKGGSTNTGGGGGGGAGGDSSISSGGAGGAGGSGIVIIRNRRTA